MRFSVLSLVAIALFLAAVDACTSSNCYALLDRIRLPPGFVAEYYVLHAQSARSLFLSPSNILYIGTRGGQGDKVYAAIDRDNDGYAEQVITIVSGENEANGIAFKDGNLWLVTMKRILRFDNIDSVLLETGVPPTPVVLRTDLPTQTSHGWRYAAFNSFDPTDPYLYIAIGADCNICEVNGIFGTIARLDSRNPAKDFEIVAYGVRNSVGFTWHPRTGDFWFTDNGRDNWGNDRPGDELNRVTKLGLHYGYPYCYADQLVDPTYNTAGNCDAYVSAAQVLGPHVAALGSTFYTGSNFPKDYSLQLFIAEHGSWNRQIPIGYRISLVRMNDEGTAPIGGPDSYTVFADGWLPDGATAGGQSWGRPVDIVVAKDGSLLVSDDKNSAVYRIRYVGESKMTLSLNLIIAGSVLIGLGLIFTLIALVFFCKSRSVTKAPVDASNEVLMQGEPTN